MNEPTLEKITAELSDRLTGQKFGKIFSLAKTQLAIDFRLSSGEYLYISVLPNSPRVYLFKRKLKELERQSSGQTSFVSYLRKRVANAIVDDISKDLNERILRISLQSLNELGEIEHFQLAIQLTGRSSNMFLLDHELVILDSLRQTFGEGQSMGEKYLPPVRAERKDKTQEFEAFPQSDFDSLSEALDRFYQDRDSQEIFNSIAHSTENNLRSELKKRRRLRKNLKRDLDNHGNAEKWKRFGDLLLANVATAKREGDSIFVVDYFNEAAPQIEIKSDQNLSITEAAEKFFKKYTKARNAKTEISRRLKEVEIEIEQFEKKLEKLILAIEKKDIEAIKSYSSSRKKQKPKKKRDKKDDASSVARKFVSSDGIEILVGKRSKDNDYLTFRVAKSLDTWLHAADYPGSHVVIRNPNKNELPPGTLKEAAELAGFYSKAKNETKVAVHYTQKKFVNKPKGAAPGLVSLSSFKTIMVAPKISAKKKDEH